ncbi:MAG: flagellar biosynthesis protein FlhF [Candidatus Cloacimonadota bacterium]|nr:flagellar biosynthesis protein FlhF [Candidatus Cloacimonadota bacterium]
MRVNTFYGKSVQEVIEQIKNEFGEDAIILKTEHLGSEKVKNGNIIKAIAAYDEQLNSKQIQKSPKRRDRQLYGTKKHSQDMDADVSGNKKYDFDLLKEDFHKLQQEFIGIKDKFPDKEIEFTPKVSEYFNRLTRNGTHRSIATNLIAGAEKKILKSKITDTVSIKGIISDEINYHLNMKKIEVKKKPLIIAVIGPTGVGKTTTIAKLATNENFFGNYNTALFSIDTFRIAAIQQLRTFANISNIPFEIIYKKKNLFSAIQRNQDKDVILIDTIGRSPRNSESILELLNLFEGVAIDEIHLILSANMNERDMYDAYNRYKLIGNVDRVIFSKLDETSQPGVMLNFLMMNEVPLAYYTNGQNVPDDIRIISEDNYVNLFFQNESNLV